MLGAFYSFSWLPIIRPITPEFLPEKPITSTLVWEALTKDAASKLVPVVYCKNSVSLECKLTDWISETKNALEGNTNIGAHVGSYYSALWSQLGLLHTSHPASQLHEVRSGL